MKPTLLTAVVLLATTIACSRPPQTAPAETGAPLPVTTVTVTVSDLHSTFEAGGIVRARLSAVIASRILAPVVDVRVRPGDRVNQGAPLITLDAREMTAMRDRARATESATRESTAAAEADVAAADAVLSLSRATHQRIADLAARTSATPQELDQAVAGLASAEAQLRSARARLAAAGAGQVAAGAATTAADTSLSYTVLTAPFNGVVSERTVDPGAMATPGAPLLTIEDPSTLRLEVQVDESRARWVHVGQGVEVSIDNAPTAHPARSWAPARVVEIARMDPGSHAFLTKLDLPREASMRTGSFGRARFTGAAQRALTVAQRAVIRRGQLAFVFVIDTNGVARLRAISPGAESGDLVEVLAGVAEGESVVVSPPASLTDGRAVTTSAASAPGARQ